LALANSPPKTRQEIYWIINNSVADYRILLKSGWLVHCGLAIKADNE